MRVVLVLFLLAVPLLSQAEVEVQAWSRATPPGATTGAIYGTFINHGQTGREVMAVTFAGARHVMIHQTVEQDGMSRMVHANVVVPPGGKVELAPGGSHIMLMGIAAPLVAGCRYTFGINWKNGDVTQHEFLAGSYGQMTMPDDKGEGASCP